MYLKALFIYSIYLLMSSGFVFSQTKKISISGNVINEHGKSRPGIEIFVYKMPDTLSILRGQYTDSTGKFNIYLSEYGDYMLGFRQFSDTNQTFTGLIALSETKNSFELRDFIISETATMLGEISIKAKKPLIQHELDKVIINVDGNYLAKGKSLDNILKLAPGIVIDSKGSVSVNGNANVTFLINGRTMKLSGEALNAFLKTHLSENISSLEIMTNPSAKYDAEGTAAIIHIVPKRNNQQGTKITNFVSYGYSGVHTGVYSPQISHKRKNTIIEANITLINDPKLDVYEIERKFKANNNRIFQNTEELRTDRLVSYQLDYFNALGKNQEIGAVWSGFKNFNKSNTDINNTLISSASGDSFGKNKRNIQTNEDNLGAFYLKKLDSLGSNVDIKANYWFSADKGNFNNYSVTKTTKDTLDDLIYKTSNNSKIFTLQMDIVKNKSNGSYLEYGGKLSNVNTIYDLNYQKLVSNLGDDIFGGKFDYHEEVYAAYFNKHLPKYKRWELMGGLRFESSRSNAFYKTSYILKYNSFFPSLFVKYALDSAENNVLNFSYSRRISRPKYHQLSPVPNYLNAYAYSVGNPFLKPEFVNRVESKYVYKNNYSLTLAFEKYNNVFTSIAYQNLDNSSFVSTTENLSQRSNLELTLSIPVNYKILSVNTYAGLSYNQFKGPTAKGSLLQQSALSILINISGALSLPKGYNLEFNGMYISPNTTGQTMILRRNDLSVGIGKTFKERTYLKLYIEDPFYFNWERLRINTEEQETFSLNRWNSRKVTLTLVHSISRGMDYNKKRAPKSNSEETYRTTR